MNRNDQTQPPVPTDIDLLYGHSENYIPPPVPVKGILAAFAGQDIPVVPVPDPGAVTITVPSVHTAPRPPRKTREEKGRELFESGAVQLPALPAADLLRQMRYAGLKVPVASQTSPGAVHAVNGTCSCQDFAKHQEEDPQFKCKHRHALKLAVKARLEQERRAEQARQEEDLLAVIPAFQPGATSLRTWSTHEERIEEQHAAWRDAHVGVHECVYFFSDGEIYREDVTHR